MIDTLRYKVEKQLFGVCAHWGSYWGVATHRIRLFFIYASFLTFGSPIIIYFIAAFWMNIKKYIYEKRSSFWEI